MSAIAKQAISTKGSMQKPEELTDLLELLSQNPPRTVVEIGTANGGTLWALCKVATDDATIVSIDLPGGEFGGGYSEAAIKGFRTFAKAQQKMHFIRDDSTKLSTIARLHRITGGKMIDFLLIDGDHTYQGVKRDFKRYAPAVNGIIAFHDINIHAFGNPCKVDKYWREIKGEYPHDEYIHDPDRDNGWGRWGGIGVIYKRASVILP